MLKASLCVKGGLLSPTDHSATNGKTANTFTLSATYKNIASVLSGNLNPMTAMMTSKLKVKGSMGYMMRNVPTVLDFVRCAQEVTEEIL